MKSKIIIIIRQKIKKVVADVIDKIKPEKVILFGSFAYGKPNSDSDVDLLFVTDTKLSGLKRYCWVSSQIEHKFPMDILVKTRKEIRERLKMGDPFFKEIIKKGEVLYEGAE